MIYFTTFILALLLSHIACATATCDDVFSPDDPIMYTDDQQGQHALHNPPVTNAPPKAPHPILYPVTWAKKYGDPNGDTKSVTCSKLAPLFPHFRNFPHFPYIGGARGVENSSSKVCGTCWNLTNPKIPKTIFIIAIDKTKFAIPGWYNISEVAFKALNNGTSGTVLHAEAHEVEPLHCYLPKK